MSFPVQLHFYFCFNSLLKRVLIRKGKRKELAHKANSLFFRVKKELLYVQQNEQEVSKLQSLH